MRKVSAGAVVASLLMLVLSLSSPAQSNHNPSDCYPLYGTNGDDVLVGNDHCQDIFGGPGNDTVYAKGGRDDVYGQGGFDVMFGGTHADEIWGGDGSGDHLEGNAGNDILLDHNVGGDNDHVCGGSDTDDMNIADGDGQDTYWNVEQVTRDIGDDLVDLC